MNDASQSEKAQNSLCSAGEDLATAVEKREELHGTLSYLGGDAGNVVSLSYCYILLQVAFFHCQSLASWLGSVFITDSSRYLDTGAWSSSKKKLQNYLGLTQLLDSVT